MTEESRSPHPTGDHTPSDTSPASARRSNRLRSAIEFAAIVTLAWLISQLVLTSVGIVGASMEPTLLAGERALVPRYETWLHRIGLGAFTVGDIVYFPDPSASGARRHHLIKRIVAVDGETVELRDGVLFVDGAARPEPYRDGGIVARQTTPPVTVGAGQVYLLGDNRAPLASLDSRRYGPVALSTVQGRVTLIVWPLLRRDANGAWRLNLRRLTN